MVQVILTLHYKILSLQVDVEATEESRPGSHSKEDLHSSIPGMYRILDLISERGTSGLGMITDASSLISDIHKVDKIIIAQDSMKCFLNEISPNAYMSLTKVDFKALDKFQVKPIGIYGSKEEIVRFLVSVAVIDDTMHVAFYFVIQFLLLTARP